MNPGLGQGFVRFGTLAHYILILAHEEGWVSNMSIRHRLNYATIAPDKSAAAIAANLKRLVANGFLYEVGRDREYGRRSFKLFGLDHRVRNGFPKYENLSPKQRTADYRARKKKKVASVFEWRGHIPSKPPSKAERKSREISG